MTVLGTAITNFGRAADILGAEMGVSDTTMAKFDAAVTTAEGAANNENPVIAAAAFGIATVAVLAIGPEVLGAAAAAAATTALGDGALVGAAAAIDATLASAAPAFLSVTSGSAIVATTSAAIGGIVAGESIQNVASATMDYAAEVISSPSTISLKTIVSGPVDISSGDATVIGQSSNIIIGPSAQATVLGSNNSLSLPTHRWVRDQYVSYRLREHYKYSTTTTKQHQ